MGNLGFKLKKFFQNKNTVTILGVVLITAIVYFGYNYRISQKTEPVKVPCAKTTIQPKTQITDDMVTYIEIPKGMVTKNVITKKSTIVGNWSNYNTIIPANSLFYKESITTAKELPDSVLTSIPDGYAPFSMGVTINSTLGNSIFPNNYVDIYLKYLDEDGKPAFAKLLQNVKILAVKDRNGKNVFENSEEDRIPSTIIFAVPEELHLLLRKTTYLTSVKSVAAELVPVPTTEQFKAEPGPLKLVSTYLKSYIESKTGSVSPDDLPEEYTDPNQEVTPESESNNETEVKPETTE